MGILKTKDISFSSQNIPIIQQANLTIEEGKTYAITGPSGCGKTTLLKLCAGLIIPTAGEAYYRDINIALMNRTQNMEFRRASGFVFQDLALWANQSLEQCLELPLRIHFPEMDLHERQRRINEVIRDVGYRRSLSLRPASLSIGEQKLIAFGRAIMCKPTLFFLDEFTESMDDRSVNRLTALVKQEKLHNNTIIFVSHNEDMILELADHVILLADGKIQSDMTRDQIHSNQDLLDLLEKDTPELKGVE